ncbi:hypothetical protein ACFQV8_37320 [Pseudonocardia benzenivorans]
MTSRADSGSRVRRTGAAAQVAGSQIGLALSNYMVLAIAARHLDTAGFAAVSSYYLLINTVGRGLFAAVELEATRAVADAVARGHDTAPAVRTARRDTLRLLVVALVLAAAAGPLLGHALGGPGVAIGLLAAGAVTMAASYLLRGPSPAAGGTASTRRRSGSRPRSGWPPPRRSSSPTCRARGRGSRSWRSRRSSRRSCCPARPPGSPRPPGPRRPPTRRRYRPPPGAGCSGRPRCCSRARASGTSPRSS